MLNPENESSRNPETFIKVEENKIASESENTSALSEEKTPEPNVKVGFRRSVRSFY